ncbi:thiol peroxidase that functions as a hydroperoxide receptor [Nadsonia fulvescens var. elongata DSM 6958]|uniref:Glutathione peroxidase n=1 Tax=Nadsonia fulvescens var. elongata DSM 6958 TaxID=857566 RepID=A0A1E3PK09_9ASCO|nr:thiol peroxidase that functions as a hydroperoxide receptor [Nadsonia fulvescens var. elongata DSM 6958]
MKTTLVSPNNIYHLSPIARNGKPYPFSDLKGKVVLIVNVASKCGFTPQYKGLEELYKEYKDQGFEIIGFPCNQFGHQEPGTDEEIGSFCQLNYGVTFPIMRKVSVNGSDADPIYRFLKEKKSGVLGFKGIKWNFEKFLINKNGEVVERYNSITSPDKLGAKITQLLKEKSG